MTLEFQEFKCSWIVYRSTCLPKLSVDDANSVRIALREPYRSSADSRKKEKKERKETSLRFLSSPSPLVFSGVG